MRPTGCVAQCGLSVRHSGSANFSIDSMYICMTLYTSFQESSSHLHKKKDISKSHSVNHTLSIQAQDTV